MVTYEFVSGGTVLALLNRDLDTEKSIRLSKKYLRPNSRISPRKRQTLFDDNVCELLRKWLDEWLDTGRNADGSESPFKRSLAKTDTARLAAKAYTKKHPFRTASDHDLNVSIEMSFEPSRSVVLGPEADIGAQSTARAEFLLVATLASDWKNGLFKCPGCEKYQVFKKTRKSYKHGRFCRLHLQAYTGKRLTTEKRQRTKARAKGRSGVPASLKSAPAASGAAVVSLNRKQYQGEFDFE